mmetsp:Transcript_23456/g.47489  ORF Transcript_23456/g.47489 Transcript_23456/m.47489 type:complete len:148 (+) Transcript_23456:150-593(+)
MEDSIKIVGHKRGRVVVAYGEGLDEVVVRANGTRLRALKDNTWRMQEVRYGENFCRYAEFRVPALPVELRALGWVRGRAVTNSTFWLAEDAVPEAALWKERYLRKALKPAPRRRMLQGTAEEVALLKAAQEQLALSETATSKGSQNP